MTHKNKTFKSGLILMGIAVVLLGVVGFSYYNNRRVATTQPPSTVTVANAETINVEYGDYGINPSVINLQQGKKYQIVMTMNHDPRGCMSTILLRGLDERVQSVQRGTTLTFNVDATTPGTYGFVCGAMGMSHGAQVVIQ